MPPANAINYININRVLKTLWEKEPISRVDIARNLDLDKSTITKIISMLMERGIVLTREEGSASRAGGRRPVNLGINRDLGAILGIELQTDSTRSSVVSLDGRILEKGEWPASPTPDTLVPNFERFAGERMLALKNKGIQVLAVSLGVSGIVNPYDRVIYRSNPLGIHSPVEFGQEIEKNLAVPVFLENDARCCCWADLVGTRGSQEKNFAYLLGEYRKIDVEDYETPAMGIGVGLVINGQVYYGSGFSPGEFKSVLKQDLHLTQFRLDAPEDIRDINQDPAYRSHLFSELARNVAYLYNMLNLSRIGIAGDLVSYEEELNPALTQAIRHNWSYSEQAQIKISYTNLGRWAVAFGAAALVLERLFGLPNVYEADKLPSGIELFEKIQAVPVG